MQRELSLIFFCDSGWFLLFICKIIVFTNALWQASVTKSPSTWQSVHSWTAMELDGQRDGSAGCTFLLYASLKSEIRHTQEPGLETTAITNGIILPQITEMCMFHISITSLLHHIRSSYHHKHFFMFRVLISIRSELLWCFLWFIICNRTVSTFYSDDGVSRDANVQEFQSWTL